MTTPRATRPLSGQALVSDFAVEVEKLREEAPWRTHGSNGVTLVKHPDLRVVLIALKSGVRIQEHHAPGRTSIQALSGELRLHLDAEVVDLPSEHLLALDRGVAYDIEAVEDSSVLLTIAWHQDESGDS